MLDAHHPRASEIREVTSDLQRLHTNFQTRFEERKKLIESTIDFYHGAQEVGVTIGCGLLYLPVCELQFPV